MRKFFTRTQFFACPKLKFVATCATGLVRHHFSYKYIYNYRKIYKNEKPLQLSLGFTDEYLIDLVKILWIKSFKSKSVYKFHQKSYFSQQSWPFLIGVKRIPLFYNKTFSMTLFVMSFKMQQRHPAKIFNIYFKIFRFWESNF